jgi:hypothetical protein
MSLVIFFCLLISTIIVTIAILTGQKDNPFTSINAFLYYLFLIAMCAISGFFLFTFGIPILLGILALVSFLPTLILSLLFPTIVGPMNAVHVGWLIPIQIFSFIWIATLFISPQAFMFCTTCFVGLILSLGLHIFLLTNGVSWAIWLVPIIIFILVLLVTHNMRR